ncbi:hypothetical protein [Mucilaginibacter sp. UR6-11]|uniref:TolB family protein n=1 Tax=Mucilaginibacter sp. UR6-11 TaxID=1435644 RepID=UPI001E4A73C8|nr:hypothetical protein [Mucilaginibacter sp. UR6-11]MCC8423355.1 hypothetical protein [Mucilaginibacter sp. UR6-11]
MVYKINILKKIIVPLLITITCSAQAQQFGGNPPSIEWKQVNTPQARVIFPTGMDSIGSRVADIIQRMNVAVLPTIGYKQKQISILLQNQTTISNAYVGLAPFRSEFYLTPEQNSFEIGSLPWADQLAIHEFRHVQQYNNFDVGLSKVLHFVFGEGGQALGNDLAVPDWFFEGDAVFNETHVSGQGRGRLPYFFNGYRALWDANRNYSWMKLRNGSLVDYVPDWYPMGYMMVAYGREKYGDDFWRKVTHDAAAYKGLFYPMQRAIKKYSGQRFDQFTADGFNHFKQVYAADRPVWNKKKHLFSSQEYPVFATDSTVIYMKSTYDRLPQFTINTNGKETKISTRSLSLDNYFDYNNGKIVYPVLHPDIRWGYRDYSELQLLDIKTGRERRLTRHTKYFSPAFSKDGAEIVAVKVDPTGKNELQIVSATDGRLITAIPNTENLFYTYPKFYSDTRLVSAVRNTAGKMSLALIDIKTGNAKYLLPFSFQPIAFPAVHDDYIYFSATAGVNDRLFAVQASTGKLFAIDNSGLGKYQPTVAANKMAWVEFTAFGYQLKEEDSHPDQWTVLPDNKLPGALPDFNVASLERDSSTDLLPAIPAKPMPVTNYNKAYHLFNFHSLTPDFSDPNYTVTLEGENVLNTFQSRVLFNYNRDEGYKDFGFDAVYGALFPYLSAGFDYTLDRRANYQGINVYWNESDIHGGLQLPFNLSSGKQLTALSVSSSVHFAATSFQQQYQRILNQSYTYLNNTITFTNSIQQARKDIYPQFGQTLALNYKTAVSGLTATQFLALGRFYLPGIFANNSLIISAAHQQKGQENVINYSNDFPFSRGYTAENLHEMDKLGADYHFPIAYPDAGIANTVYFLRIRGNLFFDYTRGSYYYTKSILLKNNFRSAGAELYFDTKWFNQQPLTFGVRYSRLLDNDIFGGGGPNLIEVILPVSFF